MTFSQLDYTFSIAEDVIKVSDHLYITEEVIPRPTTDIQDHSWTLKVRRVPGPIPDTGEEHPVTRPHFNFNTSNANNGTSPGKNFSNLYSQLSQQFMGGDYDEDDVDEDADEMGDDGMDQRFTSYQNVKEFKEEPELNDDE